MVGGFFEVEYQFKLRDMFSKEADKIIAKFDKVRDAATNANARFTDLAKNIKTSSQNLKQLSHGIAPVNQGLKTMNQSTKAVTASVKAQNQALAAQARALRMAQRSMVDYNRMAGVMMQAGQGLFRTGNILGLTVTAPIIASVFKGGKVLMEREEGVAQLRKTAGLTKANAPYFLKKVNEYSSKNPTSTEELLSIAGILGQGGFRAGTKKEIDNILVKSQTVAKMMTAFDMNAEQAGTTYSRFYNNTAELMNKNPKGRLYGKFNDYYMDRLIDFVDYQENNNTVNASQIFEAMKTRTLASGLMIPGGMDPFESAVFTTQMLNYKSASRGSNIVTQLMKDMADPKKVGKKLSEQFLANPMETLINLSQQMKTKTPMEQYKTALQVSKSYGGEFTTVMAGVDKMASALKIAKYLQDLAEEEAKTGKKKNIPLFDEQGNAYGLTASYEIKRNTFKAKLDTLGNNIRNLLASFFTRIEPILSKFIDKLIPKIAKMAKAIENMPEEQLMAIVGGLTSLALLGPALMLVGTLLNTISAIMKSIATVRSGVFLDIFREFETFIFKMLGLGSLLGVTVGGSAAGSGAKGIIGIGSSGVRALGIGGASRLVGAGALGLGVRGIGSFKSGFGGIGAIHPSLLAAAQVSKIGKNPFASSLGNSGGMWKGFKSNLRSIFEVPKAHAGAILGNMGGGKFLNTFKAIGKSFAGVNIISSLLEGAISGKWMEALFSGGGGMLGGALGGAVMGTMGGGPTGTLLGALGGGILGSGMGADMGKTMKNLFPDIDKVFIESLKIVYNLLKTIWNIVSGLWKDIIGLLNDLNKGAPGSNKTLQDINWWVTGTYKNLKLINDQFDKLTARFVAKEKERKDKEAFDKDTKAAREEYEKEQADRKRNKENLEKGLGDGFRGVDHNLKIMVTNAKGDPIPANLNKGSSSVTKDFSNAPLSIQLWPGVR